MIFRQSHRTPQQSTNRGRQLPSWIALRILTCPLSTSCAAVMRGFLPFPSCYVPYAKIGSFALSWCSLHVSPCTVKNIFLSSTIHSTYIHLSPLITTMSNSLATRLSPCFFYREKSSKSPWISRLWDFLWRAVHKQMAMGQNWVFQELEG